MRTLVLNASYEPLRLIDWQRAMYMIYTDKAEIVSTYDEVVRSVSQEVKVPKVVKLTKYVKVASKLMTTRYSRRNILERDGMKCQYCGKRCSNGTATLDHVVPKSRGGKSTWTNIVTACSRCNNKKDDRTPREAGMKLLSKPTKPRTSEVFKQRLYEEFGLS